MDCTIAGVEWSEHLGGGCMVPISEGCPTGHLAVIRKLAAQFLGRRVDSIVGGIRAGLCGHNALQRSMESPHQSGCLLSLALINRFDDSLDFLATVEKKIELYSHVLGRKVQTNKIALDAR
jgi:hypothetical protein